MIVLFCTDKENWCDKIYLNLNCNCGPYFSKSKLKTLPQFFGPGPIFLVVTKVNYILFSFMCLCFIYLCSKNNLGA